MSDQSREARLPLWAQELIKELRYKANRAAQEAEDARLLTQPGSDTFIKPYDSVPIGLGKGPAVAFGAELDKNATGLTMHRGIIVRQTKEGLDIAAWDGILVVKPRASNAIVLSTDQRF